MDKGLKPHARPKSLSSVSSISHFQRDGTFSERVIERQKGAVSVTAFAYFERAAIYYS